MVHSYYFETEHKARTFAGVQRDLGYKTWVFLHADGLEWVVEVEK